MTRSIAIALLALAVTSACAVRSAREDSHAGLTAIENVNVVDVVAGTILANRNVLIRGNRIASIIDASSPLAADVARYDGRGGFLIPGLWEGHAHVDEHGDWQFPAYLAHGITSVRDMGSSIERAVQWKQAFARAPRFFSAGPIVMGITEDKDPRVIAAANASQAEVAVRTIADRRLDYVKVFDWIPLDAYEALAAAAQRARLPVVGHLPLMVDVGTAARAGQRSIEHDGNAQGGLLLHASTDISYLSAARALVGKPFDPAGMIGSWNTAKLSAFLDSYSETKADSIARVMSAAGMFMTPTIVGYSNAWMLPPDSNTLHDVRRFQLPAAWTNDWQSMVSGYYANAPAAEHQRVIQRLIDTRARLIRTFAARGVRMVAGTDLSPWPGAYPGSSLHDEMIELVAAGLSNAHALRAATIHPASLVGVADSIGTVAVGKIADLVLLEANPLADIRNVRRVGAVFLNGKLIGSADTTPAAIVAKAIEIAGGEAALSAARALEWDGMGTVHAGGRRVVIRGTWSIQPPDSAVVATYDTTRGPSSMRRLILNGDKGWMEQGGTFTPMPPALYSAERDEFYLYSLMRLVPLRSGEFSFASALPDTAGQRGIEIRAAERPPVFAYFDRTGRLAHLRLRITDARSGAQVWQDLWLIGNIEANGVRWPREIRITMDGAPYFDLKIERLRILDQLVSPYLR